MVDLVMGAMSSLIPKLGGLLKEEYNLQTGVKERIRSLTRELEGAQAALHKVAQVPWDQLDEQVKLWACEVRESSYDMEDVLDIFLVHVKGRDSAKKEGLLKRFGEKMANLFKKSKARREISVGVKDIMTHLDEVTKRCQRYKVNDIVARPAIASTVDPRLAAMYNKVKNLVGIDKSSGELISLLQTQQPGDVPNAKMKIVSVVGVGGLGKTTLAKAVYDKLKGEYYHKAFVPVGRNPDLKKVIKGILIELDKERYMQFNFALLDEIHQFINELRDFLVENKRYFIVVDDIWEVQSWETIKLAIDDDNNCGGRILVTSRKLDVGIKAGEVYKLQQLSYDSSRELFYARLCSDQGSHVDNQSDEISNTILKKCGGIPLAIITMASLLVGKPKDNWYEIYKTIGFGRADGKEAENTTTTILSFSYYDLPSHLRTCLLYLGAFPEDSFINKGALIWKWIAEGFVHEKQGTCLFETGEGYFNDLINRSLIQGEEQECVITGCRVHDIVLDFIRSMSHEENFFTILDNSSQDTPSQSPVRRLAHHNMIIRWQDTQPTNNHCSEDMRTVRSFSAQGCDFALAWVPLSIFTLLRVLAIEDCNLIGGSRLRVEHVGNLLHLRYLSLSRTRIYRVPEEIGALRFLQTLDLLGSQIKETPSSSSLPTQLVCLRISFDFNNVRDNDEVGGVERMTSLEELVVIGRSVQCKVVQSLRELRVLTITSFGNSKSVRDLSHLDKLQRLEISCHDQEAASFVLPHQLRKFSARVIMFHKLPPCINPSGLPHLSHLELQLVDMDEQDLKNLGGLPELLFIRLLVKGCSAAISNIINDSSSNVVYFPKLRSIQLWGAMVLLFVANNKEEDKKVFSLHLWDGCSDISVPFDSEGDGNKEEEGSIFIGKGAAAAAPPPPPCRFMPSLQVLRFQVPPRVSREHYRSLEDNNLLGWEYVSSLQEVSVHIYKHPGDDASYAAKVERVEAALRNAADNHPNRPALHIYKGSHV